MTSRKKKIFSKKEVGDDLSRKFRPLVCFGKNERETNNPIKGSS